MNPMICEGQANNGTDLLEQAWLEGGEKGMLDDAIVMPPQRGPLA